MYFRALPGLLRDLQTALIKGKDGGREGVVSVADFVDCVRDSEAPLSTTEAVVVAELLSRGREGGKEGRGGEDKRGAGEGHFFFFKGPTLRKRARRRAGCD